NLSGDFRLQYLLTPDGRIRINVFGTNNYDVLLNGNIYRSGLGISYRKSFNKIAEIFRRKSKQAPINLPPVRDTALPASSYIPGDTTKEISAFLFKIPRAW